jgi:ATP-binding cassette subfamily C exporter for protease/lipase
MVLREGTIATFGPRDEVLAALKAQSVSAPSIKEAPSAAVRPVAVPVLVETKTPEPDASSANPPFNLKFND